MKVLLRLQQKQLHLHPIGLCRPLPTECFISRPLPTVHCAPHPFPTEYCVPRPLPKWYLHSPSSTKTICSCILRRTGKGGKENKRKGGMRQTKQKRSCLILSGIASLSLTNAISSCSVNLIPDPGERLTNEIK